MFLLEIIAFSFLTTYAICLHYRLRDLNKRHTLSIVAIRQLIWATDEKYYGKIANLVYEFERVMPLEQTDNLDIESIVEHVPSEPNRPSPF